MRVFKYLIPVTDNDQIVDMPDGAKVIHVGPVFDGGSNKVAVWAEVDPEATPVHRRFRTYPTGFVAIEPGYSHVGSVVYPDLVWHLYEAG